MQKKKSVTITDIARKAGVSRTTISFYLNEKFDKMSPETRSRIREVIKETDYTPSPVARSLNDKRSSLIGVLVQSLDSSDKQKFVEGIEACLKSNDCQMILSFSNRDLESERKQLEKMKALNVDGYIVSPSDHFDLIWKAMKNQSPLVVYNPTHITPYPYWIQTNDFEASFEALEKAAKAGYTRFVMISEEPNEYTIITHRCRAFDQFVSLHKLSNESLYLPAICSDQILDVELTSQIRIDEATCFFVTSSTMLRKVYPLMRRYSNLMPDRIGLIGFNSRDWASMVRPSVTTIEHPAYEAGYQAAQLLLDAVLDKNEELPSQILSCTLNVQESTLPLPDEKTETVPVSEGISGRRKKLK